jgi:hypothetical protein
MTSIFEMAGIQEPTTENERIEFIAKQFRDAKRSPDDVPVRKRVFIQMMLQNLMNKLSRRDNYGPAFRRHFHDNSYFELDVGHCALPYGMETEPSDIAGDVWDGTAFQSLYGGFEIPF